MSTSGSVSGSTPWPRLNTWPGAWRRRRGCGAPRPRSTLGRRTARPGRGCPAPAARRAAGGRGQRHAPVDADDVGARLAPSRRAARRCRRRSGCAARRRRRRPASTRVECGRTNSAVVALGERAGPGVEELHRVDAGVDLGAAGTSAVSSARRPTARARRRAAEYMSALVRSWLRLGPALHEVGRERERRAGEADQRGVAQLAEQQRRPPRPPARPARGRARAGRRRRPPCAPGRATTGPGAGHDVHADPGRVQRHDDVGEQDRGVDAVAADRLQRDLAGERGVRQACSIPVPARRARYSGSERPAWRMNHTGACDGRPRAPPRGTGRRGRWRRAGVGGRRARAGRRSGGSHDHGLQPPTAARSPRLVPGAPAVTAGPGATLRVPARARRDPFPRAEFRRAVRRVRARCVPRPELFVARAGCAAPAGAVHLGVQRRGRRRRRPAGGGPRRTRHLGRLDPPARPRGPGRLGGHLPARLLRPGPAGTGAAGRRDAARVAWSWLTEALEHHGAASTALGGTVTQTSSVRFGDIAGPVATTTSSCGRPGLRSGAELTATPTRSARSWPSPRDYLRSEQFRSPTGRSDHVLTCGFDASSDRMSPDRVDRADNAVTFTLPSSMPIHDVRPLGGIRFLHDTSSGGRRHALPTGGLVPVGGQRPTPGR